MSHVTEGPQCYISLIYQGGGGRGGDAGGDGEVGGGAGGGGVMLMAIANIGNVTHSAGDALSGGGGGGERNQIVSLGVGQGCLFSAPLVLTNPPRNMSSTSSGTCTPHSSRNLPPPPPP